MHIGIGLNLHLIPDLSEALVSECKLNPAGVVGFTGTTWKMRCESILLVSPTRGYMGQLCYVHHISPNGFRQCRIPDTGFSGFFPESSNGMGFPAGGKQDCYVHPCSHTLSSVQCWSRGLCQWEPFLISHSDPYVEKLCRHATKSDPKLPQVLGKHSPWFWWNLNQICDLLWAYVDIIFYFL